VNAELVRILTDAPVALLELSQGAVASDGRLAEQRDRWAEEARATFVRAGLRQLESPGLLDVVAQVGTHTRLRKREKEWLAATEGLTPPDELTSMNLMPGKPRRDGADTWVMSAEVGASSSASPSRLGHVIGRWSTAKQAERGKAALEQLAADLAFGLRFIRVARERHAFLEAATALAGRSAAASLRHIAALVGDELGTDGVKVYVLRRRPDGVRMQRLVRTDKEERPVEYALSETQGLADWVTSNDDWFLVTDPAPADEKGRTPERGITGRHGPLEHPARPGRLANQNEVDDPERTFLIVPLHFAGEVLGAVSVWRNTDDAFDPEADLGAMSHAAQLVSSGCRALVESEVNERVTAHVEKDLNAGLEQAQKPGDVFHAHAAAVRQVAAAAGSLLFLRDGERPVYYCAAQDSQGGGATPVWPWGRRLDGRTWAAGPADELRKHIAAQIPDAFKVREVLALKGGAFVALLDSPPAHYERCGAYDDEPIGTALRRFVDHRDKGFLDRALDALIQRAANLIDEQLPDAGQQQPEGQQQSLEHAASILLDHTAADSVRLYSIGMDGIRPGFSLPPVRSGHHWPDVQGPLTRRTLESKRAVHVLDLSDESDPLAAEANQDNLRAVVQALGWPGIQSWLCQPVLAGGRCVGAFKLLTRQDGRLLGPPEERVVEAVARRVGSQLDDRRRSELHQMLSSLASTCMPLVGGGLVALAEALVPALEGVLSAFVAPQTHFVLFATLDGGSLSAIGASKGVPVAAIADALETRRRSGTSPLHSLSPDLFPPGAHDARSAAVALPGAPHSAHGRDVLFVFTTERLAQSDQRTLDDIARVLAWITDGERRWHEWRREVGMFRHAFLGAAQGLASNAKEALRLASSGQLTPDEKASITRSINRESEFLRMWRENQRVYFLSGDVPVIRRMRGLRDLVQRCTRRYVEEAEARGVKIHEEWPSAGDIAVPIDDQLIDVALSNLLDNAVKYAFHNRDIVVTIAQSRSTVDVLVSDVGHGIPSDRFEAIYGVGQRYAEDRVRSIDGLGLGLAMARRVAELHDGTLDHTCHPTCPPRSATDARPYDVAFRLRLPRR
jgi:hypothetical protein